MFTNLDYVWNRVVVYSDPTFDVEVMVIVGVARYQQFLDYKYLTYNKMDRKHTITV